MSLAYGYGRGTHFRRGTAGSAPAAVALRNEVIVALNNDSGTKLQRAPAVLKVSDGTLLAAWQQINTLAPNADTQGVRLVYTFITYDTETYAATVDTTHVLDTPPDWENGNGLAHHPHLVKADNGDIIVIYNYGAASSTRDIVYKKWDPIGEAWGSRVTIYEHTDVNGQVLTGSNGSWVKIPSGTNAGRLIIPLCNIDGTGAGASLYSDDNGVNWSFGTIFGTGGNEWAIALASDNSLIGSVRKSGEAHNKVVSTDDGETWTVSAMDWDVWWDNDVNRSLIADGKGNLLWCSTFTRDKANSGTGFGRFALGVRVSSDDLVTYDKFYKFGATEKHPAGYSAIAQLADDTFIVLYENGFNTQPVAMRAIIFNMAEVDANGVTV